MDEEVLKKFKNAEPKILFIFFKRPDFLTIFTNQQSIYFAFFVLFSTGSVWFFIVISVSIAMWPDLVIRVLENLAEELKLRQIIDEFERRMSAVPSRTESTTSNARRRSSRLTSVEVLSEATTSSQSGTSQQLPLTAVKFRPTEPRPKPTPKPKTSKVNIAPVRPAVRIQMIKQSSNMKSKNGLDKQLQMHESETANRASREPNSSRESSQNQRSHQSRPSTAISPASVYSIARPRTISPKSSRSRISSRTYDEDGLNSIEV